MDLLGPKDDVRLRITAPMLWKDRKTLDIGEELTLPRDEAIQLMSSGRVKVLIPGAK